MSSWQKQTKHQRVYTSNTVVPKKKDEVFIYRIRRDETQLNTLNTWIVADLRKGAATNTVQIAEYLVANQLV